ncbi:MAG: hypothetical protein IJJ51_02265 [Kiritimatiellae bacterium]|nr:hypothetical protein [Kiritimatiellia bacterium]MBR4603514.1 hypothetical protein [Kiritimatiellia bacterium]
MESLEDIIGFDLDYTPEVYRDLVAADKRHSPRAYSFFAHSVERFLPPIDPADHVQALMDNFRDFAIEKFGPMTLRVLKEWGVDSCDDLADICEALLSKDEKPPLDAEDIEQMRHNFDFSEAFLEPFEP